MECTLYCAALSSVYTGVRELESKHKAILFQFVYSLIPKTGDVTKVGPHSCIVLLLDLPRTQKLSSLMRRPNSTQEPLPLFGLVLETRLRLSRRPHREMYAMGESLGITPFFLCLFELKGHYKILGNGSEVNYNNVK